MYFTCLVSTKVLRASGAAQPKGARTHNRAAVLQQLFHSGPTSRARLARATGLTRVTISTLVDSLLEERVVTELGPEDRGGKVGKRGTVVGLSTQDWCIAAIDLTRDGDLSGAVFDLTGGVLARESLDLPLKPGEEGVTTLIEFARTLLDSADRPLLGLGVSSPGIIAAEGRIIQAPNRGWYDLPLADRLHEALAVDVHVANDANTSALAEYTFGGASGDGLLSLVFGSGLGAGLVVSGILLIGAHDAVGEIGHVVAVDDRDAGTQLGAPRACACGRFGCLETIASIPALRSAVSGLSEEETEHHLAAVGLRLGEILAPVVAALDLTEVVLGGPRDLLDGSLRTSLAEAVRDRTLPSVGDALAVRMSPLSHDRALFGAAVLVLLGELGIA